MAYNRFGVIDFKWIMDHIGGPRMMLCSYNVRMSSPRLLAFQRAGKDCACIKCGVKATFFAVERQKGQKSHTLPPHLNLYGYKDGEEILFTHDHIVPRSKGGSERDPNNIQVMCYPCNQAKAAMSNSEFMAMKS